jgi:hypothetical protein
LLIAAARSAPTAAGSAARPAVTIDTASTRFAAYGEVGSPNCPMNASSKRVAGSDPRPTPSIPSAAAPSDDASSEVSPPSANTRRPGDPAARHCCAMQTATSFVDGAAITTSGSPASAAATYASHGSAAWSYRSTDVTGRDRSFASKPNQSKNVVPYASVDVISATSCAPSSRARSSSTPTCATSDCTVRKNSGAAPYARESSADVAIGATTTLPAAISASAAANVVAELLGPMTAAIDGSPTIAAVASASDTDARSNQTGSRFRPPMPPASLTDSTIHSITGRGCARDASDRSSITAMWCGACSPVALGGAPPAVELHAHARTVTSASATWSGRCMEDVSASLGLT